MANKYSFTVTVREHKGMICCEVTGDTGNGDCLASVTADYLKSRAREQLDRMTAEIEQFAATKNSNTRH